MSTSRTVPYLSFQQEQPEPQLALRQGRPAQTPPNGARAARGVPGPASFGGSTPPVPLLIYTSQGDAALPVSMELSIMAPAAVLASHSQALKQRGEQKPTNQRAELIYKLEALEAKPASAYSSTKLEELQGGGGGGGCSGNEGSPGTCALPPASPPSTHCLGERDAASSLMALPKRGALVGIKKFS